VRILEARNVFVPLPVTGPGADVSFVLVKHGPGMTWQAAFERVRDALGERADALTVWPRGPWVSVVLEAIDVAYAFSNAVWGMFLCLAGGMVASVSLLAVSGRTVELGIRRTQGATRAGICGQIVAEGLLMGAVGAAVGMAGAPAVGAWLCRSLPWRFVTRPADFLFVAVTGLAVVAASYLIPAIRAARLQPVEVLRKR
jgi:putative ABC transport system permease protein